MVGVACAESRSRFSEEISAFSESIFFYASLPTSTPTFRLMHRSLLSISSFACSKYSFVLLTSTSFALASVESVPYDQYHLLVIKAQMKDDEIDSLKKEVQQADNERMMCLKKIEQLQSDNQEMTEDLTQSVAVRERRPSHL